MNVTNFEVYNENKFPLLLTVEDVAKILRIGKVKAYEYVKIAGFPTIKIGRAVRIPTKSFFFWLDNQHSIA